MAMRLIDTEMKDQANITPVLGKAFAYVRGAAKVKTARRIAPSITTGTFGALDLYQTLLGEIDDKLSAMSLPGLKVQFKREEQSVVNSSQRANQHT
jgi:Heterokaryon incompatibility protein Het-C